MTKSLVITRITHSCHLIQIGSLTVLTDPWLTQRSLRPLRPRRQSAPGDSVIAGR